MSRATEAQPSTTEADDTAEFAELLGAEYVESRIDGVGGPTPSPPRNMPDSTPGADCQWIVQPNGCFLATSITAPTLPPGIYTTKFDPFERMIFTILSTKSDDLIEMPDSASARVIDELNKFWSSKQKFAERGWLHKRGILLYGPPGGGKTATLTMAARRLVADGGIGFICENPATLDKALQIFRRVEPARPVVCIEEDIDEIIGRYGEGPMLSLLDGESQIDNVCHVATSNYPEHLPPRIANRPSRFDRVVKIGMPSPIARRTFLLARSKQGDLSPEMLERWVQDTEGLSIAHLRELLVSVFCLDNEYGPTLERLKKMAITPSSRDDRLSAGFGAEASASRLSGAGAAQSTRSR